MEFGPEKTKVGPEVEGPKNPTECNNQDVFLGVDVSIFGLKKIPTPPKISKMPTVRPKDRKDFSCLLVDDSYDNWHSKAGRPQSVNPREEITNHGFTHLDYL